MDRFMLYDYEWGDWQIDSQLFVLRYHPMGHGKFLFEIDLKRITSSTAMMDVLFSVHRSWWATDQAFNDLERAFQDLFNWCAFPGDTTRDLEERLGILCAAD